jgi:lipoprotein signal peptidase
MIHVSFRDTAALFAARRTPIAALGATAAAVIVIDEMSKAVALHLLPELEVVSARVLDLGVVHNAGAESAAMSAVAVLVILGLSLAVCSALSAYDRRAPVMLGLIVGAGIANATDALTPPAGVVDWIVVGARGGIVVNLADAAVLGGVCLCARTMYRLVVAIRGQHAVRR